jgi:hypothetical protein
VVTENQATFYRQDVDGLRAVAVLSVVLFHAFPDLVPGGFVGVDIFFVISGYLISSIIISGLAAENFSFMTFTCAGFDEYSRHCSSCCWRALLLVGYCLAQQIWSRSNIRLAPG